jgi:sugar/nucleoside kinase (ribokinase family)
MSKKFAVYGIGNAIMDLQYQVRDLDIERLKLEKGGMRLCEEAEQKVIINELVSQKINQCSGGSAANTVILMAQLGASVSYGCLVGNDEFGKFYLSEMEQLGVIVDTKQLEKEPTGTCVVLVTPDAERTMNTHLGASAEFSDSHVNESHVEAAEWLYIEGYLFSSEKGRSAIKKAVKVAKNSETKIAVTFSDCFIVNCFRNALQETVEQSDLIFANIDEAKSYCELNDKKEIFSKLSKLVPNVALTLSERGAWIKLNNEQIRLEAYKTQAVDTTGAGDAFAAGLLYGINHSMTVSDSGKLACFLGSKVVSQLGARLHGDISEFVRRQKL